MSGSLSSSLAAVDVSGLNYTILIVVALIAVAALVVAWVFAREVLAADEGTDNMKEIAGAIQEGAAAYLARQFRTLAVFAVLVFIVLYFLPVADSADHGATMLKVSRSLACTLSLTIFHVVIVGYSPGLQNWREYSTE